MPRENRKRGKKHKKQQEVEKFEPQNPPREPEPPTDQLTHAEPSWIVSKSNEDDAQISEAPFGFLDLDVKAYFRTVDLQIREWQERQTEQVEADVDANEDKRTFFMAALNEMQGKEKQLATDPECSIILERMLYSMDDFVRRVFVDSLTGSYEVLARNRFASHVCQTLFAMSKETISREVQGTTPEIPQSEDQGELRTLTQLLLDACNELLPNIPALVRDPFASHVVRSLLVLLSPGLEDSDVSQLTVRSKKSRAWKARQGQMKSVFNDESGKSTGRSGSVTPPEFSLSARRIIEVVRDGLGENEVRAMAADKVACPTLKVLLEVEAEQDMSNERGSLMDRVTVGVISACLDESSEDVQESDFLGTLMRDANASHVLETIVTRSPPEAFNVLWSTYFEQSLVRLSVHPVANFVAAKAVDRLSEVQLAKALEELRPIWKKLIQTTRTGVLKAAIERSSTLSISSDSIKEAVLSAFEVKKLDQQKLLVPCVLAMLPVSDYTGAVSKSDGETKSAKSDKHRGESAFNSLEPKVQGSLLLQSLLKLPELSNQFVVDSIFALNIDERIHFSHNPTSSRVFDLLLDSPSVPAKSKRQFVMDFIGHYHILVDDKIGSRIGDRCWSFSDTFLKEKIARSLLSNEQDLAASFYGKFFARNLNLHLLQRRPEEWRNIQSSRANAQRPKVRQTLKASTSKARAENSAETTSTKRKRKRPEDEIDALFDGAFGKRVKKAALGEASRDAQPQKTEPSITAISPAPETARGSTEELLGRDKRSRLDRSEQSDGGETEQVLAAIKTAPGGPSQPKKKKKKP
ncbi:armadillo-type protein [Crepidotus variabilis]|uniref:Nucleolar protein 9 n=1 Tax=Crepidotus variabilis TaxID=179855 RepID=A0A9P6JSZ0_9AGAR|nr:armadillo-type protein [Crepidotus variabilis]